MAGLDMWWKDDIRNVLIGIAQGTPYMGSEMSAAEGYAFREGYAAALSAVALSLGIGPDSAPRVRLVDGAAPWCLEARR